MRSRYMFAVYTNKCPDRGLPIWVKARSRHEAEHIITSNNPDLVRLTLVKEIRVTPSTVEIIYNPELKKDETN